VFFFTVWRYFMFAANLTTKITHWQNMQ